MNQIAEFMQQLIELIFIAAIVCCLIVGFYVMYGKGQG